MEVVVDGVIFNKAHGGISRLFSEILPRMCVIDDLLHITLLTQGQLKQPLPEHKHIKHCHIPAFERYLRPNRVWKSVLPKIKLLTHDLWTGKGEGKIWHSTYYTIPEKWTGHSVATVHDMVFELFPQFYSGANFDLFRQRKWLSIQRADVVICVSETTRQDVLRLYKLDADKIHVIPNACSDVFRLLESTDFSVSTQIEQPFLFYIGNRARYKNFDLLAKAYSLWPQRKEVALVLLGDPWSLDEEKYLTDLKIHDRVQLLSDAADDETLCKLYNQAAGFIYPSLYEGFGIPLLEAMACGCPVIASRIPSTVEVAGKCPIYFDPTDVNGLIEAFDIALSEGRNSERTQMGLKKLTSYSWDKTAAKTLQVYQRVYDK